MWNIWPHVQMDMSVPDQQEGSSPKQESPQQKEDTETGRVTGRGALTYTVYHFHQWYSKGHPLLDPWRHLCRQPGHLVLTGAHHYSDCPDERNTQEDRAVDTDWLGNLNIKKTTYIIFSLANKEMKVNLQIRGHNLSLDETSTDLGVTFDRRMTRKKQIDQCTKRAHLRMALMKKHYTKFFPIVLFTLLYRICHHLFCMHCK